MIWRMGTGRTARSRLVVRKSQNSFGQKKALIEAAIWSARGVLELVCVRVRDVGEGGERTGCGGEDYEAGPVVLD